MVGRLPPDHPPQQTEGHLTAPNFDAWFAFMERPDFDGQPLHTTPGDPGGATAFGWTFTTWEGFAKLHGLNASFAHFEAMQRNDFELPSRLAFWNAVKADQLPAGVDVIWTDFQFGSFYATATLQKVLGVEADNSVGVQTITAAWGGTNKAKLLDDLTAARKAYYKTLATYPEFGNGWDRRADDCRIMAYGICKLVPAQAADTIEALNDAELGKIEGQT